MAKKIELTDDCKAFCDDLAERAADNSPHLLIGAIEGGLHGNELGYETNAQTLAYLRYLLQAYEMARNATIPHRGGTHHGDM